MRTCTKCRAAKPVEDFDMIRYRDMIQAQCKACRNEFARADYEAKKAYYFDKARARDVRLDALVNAYKDRPCMDCGVQYPPYVMDLDHRDPTTKVDSVSKMRRRRMAFATIVAEMEKCDVVCSNCHRERTNLQNCARYAKVAV